MPPRKPARHPWRDDRLGRSLRQGLNGLSDAAPDDAVWERISAELAPPKRQGLRAWLDARWPLAGEGRSVDRIGFGRPGYGHASLLSAMLLVAVFAFGNLLLLSGQPGAGACLGPVAFCSGNHLSGAEVAIQALPRNSAVAEQPGWTFQTRPAPRIDREARLRRMNAGREAYNRGEWQREPSLPFGGTAALDVTGAQVLLH